jgi:hypothetical protein
MTKQETNQTLLRITGVMVLSVFAVVFSVFFGLLARITWEGFSWGWSLFGL